MKNVLELIEEQFVPKQDKLDNLKLIIDNNDDWRLAVLDAYRYGFMEGKKAARVKKKATA